MQTKICNKDHEIERIGPVPPLPNPKVQWIQSDISQVNKVENFSLKKLNLKIKLKVKKISEQTPQKKQKDTN